MVAQLRPRVLLIAPHSDDLALSMGGLLIACGTSWDAAALTLFGASRYTRWRYLDDVRTVARLRATEDADFLRGQGIVPAAVPLPEAGLCRPSERLLAAAAAGAIIAWQVGWLSEVVVAPLGHSAHDDHVIAVGALQAALDHAAFRGVSIVLYEDHPYFALDEAEAPAAVLERHWRGTRWWCDGIAAVAIDITAILPIKEAAVHRLYGSQPEEDKILVTERARMLGERCGLSAAERLWIIGPTEPTVANLVGCKAQYVRCL